MSTDVIEVLATALAETVAKREQVRDTASARIAAAILRNCEQYDQGAIDYDQRDLEQRRQWQRAERRRCVRAVTQRLYPASR